MLGAVLFLVCNWLLFGTGLYRAVLAPDSTTAAFEQALTRVGAASRDSERDVLVLGDSRIFSGLDEETANAAAGQYRLINAGVPGTTPRCWIVFDRALDPDAARYRAVVVPVDTYSDDDGAIGSVDGNDHAFDLHYIVFHTTPHEIWRIATSFPTFDRATSALFQLSLRGPLLREDAQSLFEHPFERYRSLQASRDGEAPRIREGSLLGLVADFRRDLIKPPPAYPVGGYDELRRQVLHRAVPSPSYAAYRRQWLGYIVRRYRERGVPVIFVRLPTRPLHRAAPPQPSGTIVNFGIDNKAVVLRQERYVALETPRYFVDADHLNAQGARRFSTLLATDIARVLDGGGAAGLAYDFSGATTRSSSESAQPDGHPHRTRIGAILQKFAIGSPLGVQSYEFVVFLVTIALVYYALPSRNLRRSLLLTSSWYFYARWNAWYLAVLLALTTTDFLIGLYARRDNGTVRRGVVTVGVAANLAFLGTAKYADFLTRSVATALGISGDPWALHVLVPVGISFHTFQSISYLVDVSRGRVKATRDYFEYALYLAFFPQLLAGPIVRAARFFHEFRRDAKARVARIESGAIQITIGLLKKSVIADRSAATSDSYFGALATHAGAPQAWTGTFAFAMQIYFDFSGYSDIAIGSARILGFRFGPNFRRPYLAWSVTEFWRRWHMTLSAWLRDYLYIPLGGSRHGTLATVRSLMITMLLGGLWHGANWTFVAWGGYHGVLLSAERLSNYRNIADRLRSRMWSRITVTTATFVLVLFGWVLFRAQTFPDAFWVLREMFAGGAGTSMIELPAALLVVAMLFLEIRSEVHGSLMTGMPVLAKTAVAAAALFALELASYPGASAQFVYFKF